MVELLVYFKVCSKIDQHIFDFHFLWGLPNVNHRLVNKNLKYLAAKKEDCLLQTFYIQEIKRTLS